APGRIDQGGARRVSQRSISRAIGETPGTTSARSDCRLRRSGNGENSNRRRSRQLGSGGGRVTGRIRRLHTGDYAFTSQAYSPSVAKPCCENTTGGTDDIDGDTDGFLQHARHDE